MNAAPASAATYAFDDFSDSTGSSSASFGSADVGGTWAEFATNKCDASPTDYSISGGEGVVATDQAAAEHDCQYLDIGQQTLEYRGTVAISATPTGGSVWGYLGVRVQDRDNAYRLRVEFTSGGQAKCLMQEEAANTTTTLPATGSTKTLSGTDFSGAGDEVNVKIQADAASDTVKGKCWSAPASEPSSWDWEATSETTLEGASYDGIQIRTTSADAVTNSPSVKFDDLDAYSIYATIAAVGDISCRHDATNFNDGLGFDYVGNLAKDQSLELGHCHQKWTSDLVCGTSSTCDNSYEAIIGLGDFQYECAVPSEYLDTDKAWSYTGDSRYSWRRASDSGRWYPAVGNHEYESVSANCPLYDWTLASDTGGNENDFDPGECYYQVFNGTRSGGTTGDGINTVCDPATTGVANPDGHMAKRPDGEDAIGGFYTFDIGTWRFIVLNAGENCNEKGPVCDDGTGGNWAGGWNDQADYLDEQLDNNTQPCVGVAFHYPRWSSDGPRGTATTTNGSPNLTSVTPTSKWTNGMLVTGAGIPAGTTIVSGAGTSTMVLSANATATASGVTITGTGDSTGDGGAFADWWDIMYKGVAENEADHKVDLVLNGHDHFYQRFGKMNESGGAASDGIRQFISGAGGKSIRAIQGTTAGVSEAMNPGPGDSEHDGDSDPNEYPNKTAGVLELELKPNGYQYRFRPSIGGEGTDNGTYTDPMGGGLSSEVSCNADGL